MSVHFGPKPIVIAVFTNLCAPISKMGAQISLKTAVRTQVWKYPNENTMSLLSGTVYHTVWCTVPVTVVFTTSPLTQANCHTFTVRCKKRKLYTQNKRTLTAHKTAALCSNDSFRESSQKLQYIGIYSHAYCNLSQHLSLLSLLNFLRMPVTGF